MSAYTVRRLGAYLSERRYYVGPHRVSRREWILAGLQEVPYASRMETRPDGSVIVREYHAEKVRS